MSALPISPILSALLAKSAALRSANPSRAYFGARTATQKKSRKAHQSRGEIFQAEVEIAVERARAKQRRRGGQPGNSNAVRTPVPKPAELEQVETRPNPRYCAWKPCGALLPHHLSLSFKYCPYGSCAAKARKAQNERQNEEARAERLRARAERRERATGAQANGRRCERCGRELIALSAKRKFCREWKCRRAGK